MRKKINLLILVFCLLQLNITVSQLYGHTYRLPLILDTDMAPDDARAIVLLFNSDMADVQLAVTSDGAVSPARGANNLKTLLSLLDQKNIKIAVGRELQKESPPWREWSENIFSFAAPDTSKTEVKTLPAAAEIVNVLRAADAPCVYLCLGPLTNLADALQIDDSITANLSRLIYYGTSPGNGEADWNTGRDLLAARRVFNSGIKINVLSNPQIQNVKFDNDFFMRLKELHTPAADFLVKIHDTPQIKALLSRGHFRIWDDIAVIYLNRPDLFTFTKQGRSVFEVKHYEKEKIYNSYLKLLGLAADSHLKEREVVVLENFPVDPELFKTDVAPFVKKIMEKHGVEEWKACVLTNELHRHLGIYSIIGAKMGIRAREILDAPLDDLRVFSFAGSAPPLSCLNDGLQVSTGASLGRGTIKIASSNFLPAAEFTFGEQRLVLTVTREIVRRVKQEIKETIRKYGNLSPDYFAQVRRLSIKYWYELDRTKIFNEERK